ncbi:MAG TPA: ABC transporter substrate-binding protein [Stellaceae bacterium]|nr:ABC transporter substrate-binding protein [Stellaceae bacterium]
MRLDRSITRRRLLRATGVAAVATLPVPRLVYAQTPKQVKFTLPWVADGSNLFTYVAKEMGFWSKQGLDVSIARGFGSVAAAESVGTGKFDFSTAAPLAAILQVIKGLPIVALGACAYDATMGIGVLDDSPIKSPKDLEGKQMGSTATSGEFPFLAAFAEKAGFDLSKVTIVQVDNKVRDRLLPEKKVDAISGFATTFLAEYIATGVKAHSFLYSHYGIPNYGNTVITQPKRVAEEPELCAAFVDGMMQGLKATMLDPAEAIKILFKALPELALAAQAKEQVRVGTGLMIYVSAHDTLTSKGMGYIDPADFKAQADLVMKFLAKPEDKLPVIDSMMTNKFTGGIKFTEAEMSQAQKNCQEFRSYVT